MHNFFDLLHILWRHIASNELISALQGIEIINSQVFCTSQPLKIGTFSPTRNLKTIPLPNKEQISLFQVLTGQRSARHSSGGPCGGHVLARTCGANMHRWMRGTERFHAWSRNRTLKTRKRKNIKKFRVNSNAGYKMLWQDKKEAFNKLIYKFMNIIFQDNRCYEDCQFWHF